MEMKADRCLLDKGLCGGDKGNSQIRAALPLYRCPASKARTAPPTPRNAPARQAGPVTPHSARVIGGAAFTSKTNTELAQQVLLHHQKKQHTFYPRDNITMSVFGIPSSPGSATGQLSELELKYVTSFLGARVSLAIKQKERLVFGSGRTCKQPDVGGW